MIHVFVDSNVFLSFYHFSSEDLIQLKKLTELIQKGDLKLIITEQVVNEVRRNREGKIADALKKFDDAKLDISFPQICKNYEEYPFLRDKIDEIRSLKARLADSLHSDIASQSLLADQTIGELFQLSEIVKISDYIEAAKLRFDLGNPPGKNSSYGDAINWELLLGFFPKFVDLFFISDDKDYKSPLNENAFHPFLTREWSDAKQSEIRFYSKLSRFFEEHHKDIELGNEKEKERLIEDLYNSGSFKTTHSVVGRLGHFDFFTDEEAHALISAALTNNQVSAIAQDEDINSFFVKLFRWNSDLLDADQIREFRKIFLPEEYEKIYLSEARISIENLPF